MAKKFDLVREPIGSSYVVIHVAQHPTNDYPFGCTPIMNGKEGQEVTSRSLRDCLLVGNGMINGMMLSMSDNSSLDHNVIYTTQCKECK